MIDRLLIGLLLATVATCALAGDGPATCPAEWRTLVTVIFFLLLIAISATLTHLGIYKHGRVSALLFITSFAFFIGALAVGINRPRCEWRDASAQISAIGRGVLSVLSVAPAAAQSFFGAPSDSSGSCPAGHHARQVTDWSAPMNCTLMVCLGKLVCPADGGACTRMPANDCNSCSSPPPLTLCLSDEELRAATGGPAQN